MSTIVVNTRATMINVAKRVFPRTLQYHLRPFSRKLTETYLKVRILDRAPRLEPSYMIIGAMKSGTSSLFSYLCRHPKVVSPILKEIDYFNYNWSNRSKDWYLAHFPKTGDVPTGVMTGEATPGYIAHFKAAERAAQDFPNTKIIVLLRNPVDRAISHYFHSRNHGWDDRPINEALLAAESMTVHEFNEEEEIQWFKARFSQFFGDRKGPNSILTKIPVHRAYIGRSLYFDQLSNWFQHFNRDQILVLKSEDFFSNSKAAYQEVLAFLSLDAIDIGAMEVHNAGTYSEKVDPSVLRQLEEIFEEPNRRLYQLIGRDLGWAS